MRRVWVVAGALVLSPVAPLPGQAVTVGAAVTAVAGDDWFAGLGPSLGVDLSRDVTLTGTGFAGRMAGRFAGRGELLLQLRAPAARATRTRLIGLAGVAATTVDGAGPYLVVGAGMVRQTGRSGEWWAEAGVGGGVRLVGGVRWRPWRKRQTAPVRGGP